MNDILLRAGEMLKESKNIPEELKGCVVAICKAYIRNSDGMISLKGVENVCNTNFVRINEDDKNFTTENNYFGETDTQILNDGSLKHTMSYVDFSDIKKLIMILTHEIGHVLTDCKVNKVLKNGIFPFIKRTGTYCINSCYINGKLMTKSVAGFRLSDGFLETICKKIFEDKIFRKDILDLGFDLEDFVYKDSRLFPSRVYDEFRDCFLLFDSIMDGKLFEFACMEKETNEEYIKFINENRINVIYEYIDKALESLWGLKKYENSSRDEKFDLLVEKYFDNKKELLMVADILSENSKNKDNIDKLIFSFADLSKFRNTLPFTEEEFKYFSEIKFGYSK